MKKRLELLLEWAKVRRVRVTIEYKNWKKTWFPLLWYNKYNIIILSNKNNFWEWIMYVSKPEGWDCKQGSIMEGVVIYSYLLF
jgi:hypothetical protein